MRTRKQRGVGYQRPNLLGEFLRMGKGEMASGGAERQSNLTDALESVIGAVFLDGGMKGVHKVFRKLFVPRVAALDGDVWADNPKGKLQEYSQRKWRTSPRYRVVKNEGPAHARVFTVEVELQKGVTAKGSARSKQEAEMKAATNALRRFRKGARKRR